MSDRRFSPLIRRVLAVNALPLAALLAGVLYLDDYREGLVDSELAALGVRAEVFAAALGEGAVGVRPDGGEAVLPGVAGPMLRRLVGPTRSRTYVFDAGGEAIADSGLPAGGGAEVQVEPLPSGEALPPLAAAYDALAALLPRRGGGPPFPEAPVRRIAALPEMAPALDAETPSARWSLPGGRLRLGAAVAVQRFKKVLGAVVVTADADEIDAAVRDARLDILKLFAGALALTVLLSLYLARTIAGPVRHLARAADAVRRGPGRGEAIPDYAARRDEIGDLSAALREMTEALRRRLAANERFAADVAHELRTPLASLRSAVETAARVRDPGRQAALAEILRRDVDRLDRLIGDISDASRLDAELARSRAGPVDVGRLLEDLVAALRASGGGAGLAFEGGGGCVVTGAEDRLAQVFRNLVDNARSFTPPGGAIRLSARREGAEVVARVDDEGTGIPPESLEAIFERFYSERPEGESFGRHSGLGLSISRQIVEAHGGRIRAENRPGAGGRPAGARFEVRLPAAEGL